MNDRIYAWKRVCKTVNSNATHARMSAISKLSVRGYKRCDSGDGQEDGVVLEGTAALADESGGGDRTHWSVL